MSFHPRNFLRAALLAAAFAGTATWADAQSDRTIDRLIEAFEEAIEDGRDHAAQKLADELDQAGRLSGEALADAAASAENLGLLKKADGFAERRLKEAPDDVGARVFRLRQLRRRGALDEVEKLAAPWIEPSAEAPPDAPRFDVAAAAEVALAKVDRGADAEAAALFDAIVDEARRVVLRSPHALVGLADAYLFIGGRQGVDLAEKVLIEAQEAAPRDPAPGLKLANLYLKRKYLHGDAHEETADVLKIRPNLADAYRLQSIVLIEWTNAENNYGRAMAAQAACLDVRPDHPDALVDRAYSLFSDGAYGAGRELARKAAEVEPRNLRALSAVAAADYLEGDREAAERGFRRVLELDPTFGDGREALASVLNQRRRWPEALEQARLATRIDPKAARHWDAVAQYALYLAQTPEGLSALEKANALDAYNWAWRRNMELVLDLMRRRYVDVETERFLVRVPKEERPALRRLYGPFFDRSFDLLTKKYGYVPTGAEQSGGRVVVEMFDDASDFGARTFGYVYPGFLGVCFGPLVTLNGPKALPAAMNSWARTFHHEFAHSITVGLAEGRMPRWLTEGLSTYEEIAFEPSWTRGLDRELFDAWATDDLCRVADFDLSFRGPRTTYAYYQAGLVAEMLVERFGMTAITDLLRAYAADLSTEKAFERALKTSPAEIDRMFERRVAERVGGFAMLPRWSGAAYSALEAKGKANPKDVETLVRLAIARFRAGRKADSEAAAAAARALGSNDDRLRVLEAWRALGVGRVDEAETIRSELASKGVADFDLAYGLAAAAAKKGDGKSAEARYREAIAAFPTDAGAEDGSRAAARVALIELLRGRGAVDEAMALAEEHLRYKSEALALRKDVIAWRLSKGDEELARKHLELHVLIDARDYDVHMKLGTLRLKAGDAEGAYASAEGALEVAGVRAEEAQKRADARALGAEAAFALGRVAEARAKIGAALSEVPDHARSLELKDKLPPASPEGGAEDSKEDRR